MSEVTAILEAAAGGDPHAAAELLPLVYEELRKLAAARLAQEKPGQTLDATALVHEAYLRLVNGDHPQKFNGRGHFFAAAAEAMRRILVDQARRRKAAKRGGEWGREEFTESIVANPRPLEELLAVDENLNMTETAAALGISVRSATDVWAYARAWLHQQLGRD
ncbi:MAG: ECF-type sigma factor [Pirellulaceae bacterium]|nr:ECF-type sigma factor [Pirellulaceae bacterium]